MIIWVTASDVLSQQLPQGSGYGTVTNGFPSVTSVLQHLVFKMSFQHVLFTGPSPLPGGNEKVILIFQRSSINYSAGLCIAYSLQVLVAQLCLTLQPQELYVACQAPLSLEFSRKEYWSR